MKNQHGLNEEKNHIGKKIFSQLSVCLCVFVNSATNALGLSHDGLSRHRAGLPVHPGAAVNKVKELPYNSPPKQITSPAKDRLHLCPLHLGGKGPASSSDKGCSHQKVQCVEPLFLPPSQQSAKRGRSTMNLAMVSRQTPM